MNGSLSIACGASDGAVVVSFKNASKLMDKEKFHKVFPVCSTIGVSYAGLQPDFRAQLSIAQRICQEYYDVYEKFPALETFVHEYSLSVQEHTQRGGFRPFGTFLLFVGAGSCGPCCYQVDPSGSFRQVSVTAAGMGYDEAKKFMERRLELVDDNIVNSVIALKEFCGKEIHPEDISIGVYRGSEGRFHVYSLDEVKEVFDSMRN